MTRWRELILNEMQPGMDENDRLLNYEEIPFEDGLKSAYRKAAHACLFARDPKGAVYWSGDKTHAIVLMQSRFDGMIGFPGGMLDGRPDEPPVDGLNREMEEEINFDVKRHQLTQDDFLLANVNHKKEIVNFFYAKEFSLEAIKEIERRTIDAVEWGQETMGTLRVPLLRYTLRTQKMRALGFVNFLCNRFPGNAKMQLLETLLRHNVLPRAEFDSLLHDYVQFVTGKPLDGLEKYSLNSSSCNASGHLPSNEVPEKE